jgi:hypothetical protein
VEGRDGGIGQPGSFLDAVELAIFRGRFRPSHPAVEAYIGI